jgi:prolipoprotein diacylglyceryl transferase
VWDLGPIPIRAYALCIILGIVASIWMGERRWVARGGKSGTVSDVAVWAVIFGLIGGRLYHVITDNELYFRAGRDPWRAFYVWEGGLGVWGAIALGGVGAWIACHRRGIKLPPFADACAPGIAVAQGLGRWGNYFNQELFGRPTNLPWAVQIDPDRPSTVPGVTTYHPTFLYESLWDLALAAVLIYVDRRYKMGRGRVFALYVMGYCAGRIWIEALRIDTANEFFHVRLNVWTSIVVFAGGLVYFLLHRGPREREVEPGMVLVTPDGVEAVASEDDAPGATGATTGATAAATAAAADKDVAEDDLADEGDADEGDADEGDEADGDEGADDDEPVKEKVTADDEPVSAEPTEDDEPAEHDLTAAERADDELAYGEPGEDPTAEPTAEPTADPTAEPTEDEPVAAATIKPDGETDGEPDGGTTPEPTTETPARRRLLPAGRRKR